MNWYKKAQLQETLPYFQEFEEYGDYVPKDEELEIKLKSMGLSLSNEIGRGDSGIAYLLSNGDILKITTNAQEGKVAQSLIEKNHPSIAQYKEVWKKGDLYYIIMEQLDEVIGENSELGKMFNDFNIITNNEKCYSPDCAIEILKNNSYFNSIDEGMKNEILNYLNYLKEVNIPIFDFLNPNNIGIKNGKIKFFDIT